MSYIIKFKNDKFIISNKKEIIILDYDNYYKELRDFLLDYNYINLIIGKEMKYFFLNSTLGLKFYKSEYFSKMYNTNKIPLYDIAKIIYIFYLNKIL